MNDHELANDPMTGYDQRVDMVTIHNRQLIESYESWIDFISDDLRRLADQVDAHREPHLAGNRPYLTAAEDILNQVTGAVAGLGLGVLIQRATDVDTKTTIHDPLNDGE